MENLEPKKEAFDMNGYVSSATLEALIPGTLKRLEQGQSFADAVIGAIKGKREKEDLLKPAKKKYILSKLGEKLGERGGNATARKSA